MSTKTLIPGQETLFNGATTDPDGHTTIIIIPEQALLPPSADTSDNSPGSFYVRNSWLRMSMSSMNTANKGKGIAERHASHDALEVIDNDPKYGLDAVTQTYEKNRKRAVSNFERACNVCPLAGKCALRGRFGNFYNEDNLGKASERIKFQSELGKNPKLQCDVTLDKIKSRRKKAA